MTTRDHPRVSANAKTVWRRIGSAAALTAALAVTSAARGQTTTTPAPTRLTGAAAVAIGRDARGLAWFTAREQSALGVTLSFTAERDGGRWTVAVSMAGPAMAEARVVYRVVVDDESREIADETSVGARGATHRLEDVLRTADDLLPGFPKWPDAWLVPEYDPVRETWRVTSVEAGHVTGEALFTSTAAGGLHVVATVDGAIAAEGEIDPDGSQHIEHRQVQFTPPSDRSLPGRIWEAVRGRFMPRHWLWIYAAAFLVIFVDPRRVASLRTADTAVIAALGPISLLMRPPSVAGWVGLAAALLYLFGRLLVRGARPTPHGFKGRLSQRVLVILTIVLFAHQAVAAWPDTATRAGQTGLVGGERLVETRDWPWTGSVVAPDSPGPLHYIIHGLAARAWPTGRSRGPLPTDPDWRVPDPTGARVVSLVWHLLSVIALIGIGRKHAGSTRIGWLLAAGYLLLSVHFGYLLQTSARGPTALVLLAFWAFPSPLLSGLFLGLGAASLWQIVLLVPLWLSAFAGPSRRSGLVTFLVAFPVMAALPWGVVIAVHGGVAADPAMGAAPLPAPASLAERLARWGIASPTASAAVTGVLGALCLSLAVWPRGAPRVRLAALTAAVGFGAAIWTMLMTGTPLIWIAPMVLVGLFTPFKSAECGGVAA